MNCFSRKEEKAVHVKRKPRNVKVWPDVPQYFGEDDRFEFKDRISSGGYAFVYSGYDHKTNRPMAVKVPNTERAKAIDALKKEYKYLKKLARENAVVPDIVWFGQCKDRVVMVMELLGDCLGDVRKHCGRTFSLPTILRLAVELLDGCKVVHGAGILHRDCKLKNYLLGPNNQGAVYLIDFGLSGQWKKNGKHIKFGKNLPPYGTMRYAPLAVHLGHEQGRKDDLEALGYMLIYLARGKLPWQSLWHQDKKVIWRDVGIMKQNCDFKDLCQDISPCFEQFMRRIRKLNFVEEPPYEELKKLFSDTMEELGYPLMHPYDWEILRKREDLVNSPQSPCDLGSSSPVILSPPAEQTDPENVMEISEDQKK